MTVRAELDSDGSDRIVLESAFHHKDQAKSLPGASWSSADRVWKLPLAWTTCLALRATFGDELEIGDNLTEWAVKEKTERIDPAVALREVVNLDDGTQLYPYESPEPLKLSPAVPDTPITQQALLLQKELKLFPHQAAGAAFMATAMQAGIFDETGTGKSAQAIAALRIMHRLGHNVFPVLIVCPNTVKKTWERELAQWWPGLVVSNVKGGVAARRKALTTPAHAYIMNWDLLAKHSRLSKYGNKALLRCKECGGLDERVTTLRCEVHKRELNFLTFSTVIADEVHRAKDPHSKWTRALWATSETSTYRYGLTGTPIQDTLVDMWAILRYMLPLEYSAKSKFTDRFAETGYNVWGAFMVYGVRESARAEFDAGINPRTRRMLKKIVLPFLPPIMRETRYVELLPAQAKAYKQMVKDTLAEIDGGTLVGVNPLSRATRLLQFSSAYAELDTKTLPDGRVEQHVRLVGPSNKVNAFINDVLEGDFGDSSIIVFAQSRQLIDILSAEMTRKKLEHGLITGAVKPDDRQSAIDAFQDGKTKYILITIDAGGVGLTLTAADTMVFLQRSYSSTAMKQAESRAHRIGSEIHDRVLIVDYVSEDTLEERQVIRLGGKYARIESIVRDEELLKKLLTGEDVTLVPDDAYDESVRAAMDAEIAAILKSEGSSDE